MAILHEQMGPEMFGPDAVDTQIRHAITLCWMLLPKEKRTVATVKDEIRRLVERALANLEEDQRAFGQRRD